jgi:septum formation protein
MLHEILADKQVVLASASPRRKIIFDFLGIKALVLPADIEENEVAKTPQLLVQRHAYIKAEHIAKQMSPDTIVVGSDTIVYHDKEVLGKPTDKYVAYEYLHRLSGQKHYVYSGVAVSYKNKIHTSYTRTAVEFEELSREEIQRLFSVIENIKHKALLMVAYDAGLRLSEIRNLEIGDIDSQRNVIRVRQGNFAAEQLFRPDQKSFSSLQTN